MSSSESGAVLVWEDAKRIESGLGSSLMLSENAAHASVAHDEDAIPLNAKTDTATVGKRQRGRRPSDSLKRIMDLVLAIPLAVFLIPILITLAIVIIRDDKGPILFKQTRRGKDGKEFTCYKFRTMVVDAQERLDRLLASDAELRREWEDTQKLKIDPRITRRGGFLRRTSLDELPQLWNIIKGDMSVVGPRPIVESEVRRYGSDIEHYDSVKPGVIGLWQINGRSDTTYAERVALDVEYARRRSVLLDTYILARSIPEILLKRGAY
ncbi:MAG: sugar transferase [Pseudomonadota bacterium]